ncbi:MAG TPA: flagellar biosynthesis anti-sigma factor FlgM [Bryobacteraceae bacterium]|nr:flagellar biosynthesis anti-sigma factor FlgM [Bryobacteraceae bacterium]
MPASRSEGQQQNRRTGGTTDQVQISNLSFYMAAARSDSPAQMEKLSALRTAVSGGQYQADANVVSASIIQESLQLSGANWL